MNKDKKVNFDELYNKICSEIKEYIENEKNRNFISKEDSEAHISSINTKQQVLIKSLKTLCEDPPDSLKVYLPKPNLQTLNENIERGQRISSHNVEKPNKSEGQSKMEDGHMLTNTEICQIAVNQIIELQNLKLKILNRINLQRKNEIKPEENANESTENIQKEQLIKLKDILDGTAKKIEDISNSSTITLVEKSEELEKIEDRTIQKLKEQDLTGAKDLKGLKEELQKQDNKEILTTVNEIIKVQDEAEEKIREQIESTTIGTKLKINEISKNQSLPEEEKNKEISIVINKLDNTLEEIGLPTTENPEELLSKLNEQGINKKPQKQLGEILEIKKEMETPQKEEKSSRKYKLPKEELTEQDYERLNNNPYKNERIEIEKNPAEKTEEVVDTNKMAGDFLDGIFKSNPGNILKTYTEELEKEFKKENLNFSTLTSLVGKITLDARNETLISGYKDKLGDKYEEIKNIMLDSSKENLKQYLTKINNMETLKNIPELKKFLIIFTRVKLELNEMTKNKAKNPAFNFQFGENKSKKSREVENVIKEVVVGIDETLLMEISSNINSELKEIKKIQKKCENDSSNNTVNKIKLENINDKMNENFNKFKSLIQEADWDEPEWNKIKEIGKQKDNSAKIKIIADLVQRWRKYPQMAIAQKVVSDYIDATQIFNNVKDKLNETYENKIKNIPFDKTRANKKKKPMKAIGYQNIEETSTNLYQCFNELMTISNNYEKNYETLNVSVVSQANNCYEKADKLFHHLQALARKNNWIDIGWDELDNMDLKSTGKTFSEARNNIEEIVSKKTDVWTGIKDKNERVIGYGKIAADAISNYLFAKYIYENMKDKLDRIGKEYKAVEKYNEIRGMLQGDPDKVDDMKKKIEENVTGYVSRTVVDHELAKLKKDVQFIYEELQTKYIDLEKETGEIWGSLDEFLSGKKEKIDILPRTVSEILQKARKRLGKEIGYRKDAFKEFTDESMLEGGTNAPKKLKKEIRDKLLSVSYQIQDDKERAKEWGGKFDRDNFEHVDDVSINLIYENRAREKYSNIIKDLNTLISDMEEFEGCLKTKQGQYTIDDLYDFFAGIHDTFNGVKNKLTSPSSEPGQSELWNSLKLEALIEKQKQIDPDKEQIPMDWSLKNLETDRREVFKKLLLLSGKFQQLTGILITQNVQRVRLYWKVKDQGCLRPDQKDVPGKELQEKDAYDSYQILIKKIKNAIKQGTDFINSIKDGKYEDKLTVEKHLHDMVTAARSLKNTLQVMCENGTDGFWNFEELEKLITTGEYDEKNIKPKEKATERLEKARDEIVNFSGLLWTVLARYTGNRKMNFKDLEKLPLDEELLKTLDENKKNEDKKIENKNKNMKELNKKEEWLNKDEDKRYRDDIKHETTYGRRKLSLALGGYPAEQKIDNTSKIKDAPISANEIMKQFEDINNGKVENINKLQESIKEMKEKGKMNPTLENEINNKINEIQNNPNIQGNQKLSIINTLAGAVKQKISEEQKVETVSMIDFKKATGQEMIETARKISNNIQLTKENQNGENRPITNDRSTSRAGQALGILAYVGYYSGSGLKSVRRLGKSSRFTANKVLYSLYKKIQSFSSHAKEKIIKKPTRYFNEMLKSLNAYNNTAGRAFNKLCEYCSKNIFNQTKYNSIGGETESKGYMEQVENIEKAEKSKSNMLWAMISTKAGQNNKKLSSTIKTETEQLNKLKDTFALLKKHIDRAYKGYKNKKPATFDAELSN